MDDTDLDEIATMLQIKAVELRVSVAELTGQVEADATMGSCRRMGESITQETQQIADTSTAESLQRTLNQVRDAQKRLESGSFGHCVVCGEPIPQARLEFRPWAATCVEHAA